MKPSFAQSNAVRKTLGFVEKYINKTILTNLLFCCAPLLVFLFVIYLLNANPFHWVPLWNDESGWYIEINSVVKYGAPLGYTGYNETHAAIGTFGPWGAFIVCAMSMFGKIFGWHHYSPILMNVTYWMLANFVFLLFAKPKFTAAIKLTALNAVLFLSIFYMFTGMSESTRFSMSIMLAGMFYYLLKDENRDKRSYLMVLGFIAPVLLFLFVNSYILFAFLLPVYGYAWFKYLNPGRCRPLLFVVLLVFLPALFFLACFFITMKTVAPYLESTLQTYLDQPTVGAFLKVLKETVCANYQNADLSFVFRNSASAAGCFSSYLFFYYCLLIIAAVQLVATLKTGRKLNLLNLLVCYALSLFIVAFLALYSTLSTWTYMRGLNVALVFSLYLVCMLEWPKLHLVLFGFIFMQFFPFATVIRDDMAVRYTARHECGGGHELFDKYSKVFSTWLVPSRSEDPWDNTVATYGSYYNFGCTIPAGLSWNAIMDGHAVSKPRYIVAGGDIEAFSGYRKTYKDDLICIFEKIQEPASPGNE